MIADLISSRHVSTPTSPTYVAGVWTSYIYKVYKLGGNDTYTWGLTPQFDVSETIDTVSAVRIKIITME